MMAGALDFSVVFRLTDDHGDILECLKSWIDGQSLDRRCYEVIVAADGSRPDLEPKVRAMLTARDSLIVRPVPDSFELYNAAARQAVGRLILFTEGHCRGDANCLSEMLTFMDGGGYDVGRCGHVGVGYEHSWVASLERRTADAFFAAEVMDGDWRKIHIAGCAIRRDVFLAAGGFEVDFVKFSPTALAARLDNGGRKMGFAGASIVYHTDADSLKEIIQGIEDYLDGDMRYRARYPADYCERYFGYSPQWAERGERRADFARSLCAGILRTLPRTVLSRRRAMMRHLLRRLAESSPAALMGQGGPRRLAWLGGAFALARTRLWRFSRERSYRTYGVFRVYADRYFRVRAVERYVASLAPVEAKRYDLATLGPERLAGFFAPEERHGVSFCWSTPAAVAEVSPPKANYVMRLEMLSLRPPPAELAVFFDGHRLRKLPTDTTACVSFRLTETMFRSGTDRHTLVLLCAPFQSEGDSRALGLPLTAIEFQEGLAA